MPGGADPDVGARYGVRRCWCGRPDCAEWCVGDFVQGSIEASLTKYQAEVVAFVLNNLEGSDTAAVSVTNNVRGGPSSMKTTTFCK